jgi:hypothetical protein
VFGIKCTNVSAEAFLRFMGVYHLYGNEETCMFNKAKIYRLVQKTYAIALWSAEAFFGINFAKKMDARLRFGRKLNLRNPQTLADKVSYISLHALPQAAVRCTDKWEARSYVAEKGLENILIPVHGSVVSSANDLDFSLFPNQFVLKATHGCRMNFICLDKTALDQDSCRKTARQWLSITYGTYSMEPHYRSIPHRLYCESYIGDSGSLVDYKIHCLNGEPSFILACKARASEDGKGSSVAMYLYDTQWNALDVLHNYRGHGPGTGSIPKPKKLDEMLSVARKLSEDFDFVRVDLYETDGKIWFGELTFTPANGVFPSYSLEFLEREGKKLTISK